MTPTSTRRIAGTIIVALSLAAISFDILSEQSVAILSAIGVALWASREPSDANWRSSLSLIGIGLACVVMQLALNKVLHTESLIGMTAADVLFLRQIRSATGLVWFGYVYILAGALGCLRSFLLSRQAWKV